jgi:DNA-binding XRE family transcriptional regulator
VIKLKIKLKDPNKLKKLLIVHGYNQTDFAKEIEIAGPYLNQIIKEERYPSPKIAKSIYTKLGVEFGDIFFIEDVCKSYLGEKEEINI